MPEAMRLNRLTLRAGRLFKGRQMPNNFDIEHEEINLELAGEDKLGVKGLNLVYLTASNDVQLRLNEELAGGKADITERDARDIAIQKTHIERNDQSSGKTTTATVTDARGHVVLTQVSKQSQDAGKTNFDTETTGYNGWQLRSTHLEIDAQGTSDLTVTGRDGRLARTSHMSMQEKDGKIHAEAVTKDANQHQLEMKTLDLYQAAGKQSGDYNVKDGGGHTREMLHFETSSLQGNGTVTDAVVKDARGYVAMSFHIETGVDANGSGRHVDISKKDAQGRVIETVHVQITHGANQHLVDTRRSNALGRKLSSTHMEVGK